MHTTTQNEAETIKIRRARVDSITVYDVTEQELDQLEAGGDGGIYLNLASSIFATAVSFLIAIMTTRIDSTRQFDVFVIVISAAFLGTLVFGILWWKSRTTVSSVIVAIKQRMPLDLATDIEDKDSEAVEKIP